MMSPVSDKVCAEDAIKRRGVLRMKDSKKKNSEGCWTEPMLFRTHSTPQNLTSNELTGERREKSYTNPLGRVSYTLHYTGTTFWMVNTHGTQPPKDGVRGGVRKGIQWGQEMLWAIYLSSEMLQIARGWLHGAVRKREGKLIGLCLFIPDTLLNQSWQAWKREKESLMGEIAENASKNMTGLHNGTDKALFFFNTQCISWREVLGCDCICASWAQVCVVVLFLPRGP